MRIVITNLALNHYYGTETWTYAMAKELSKSHDVTVFTLHQGNMSSEIEKFCKVTTEMPDADFYICNHKPCFEQIPKGKRVVFTSHGRGGVEEFPDENCHKVGVTEETAKGNFIIRNGIDCERFKPEPMNQKLKTVLYLSHPHYAMAKEIVKEACEGLELITIEEEIFEIEKLINKADIVVTLGRGILESLACGRNVISADWRDGWMNSLSGGGMITEKNFDFLKTHAFSGRNKPIEFTPERLRKEFEKYSPKNYLREKILSEFNIKKQCQKYMTFSKLDI